MTGLWSERAPASVADEVTNETTQSYLGLLCVAMMGALGDTVFIEPTRRDSLHTQKLSGHNAQARVEENLGADSFSYVGSGVGMTLKCPSGSSRSTASYVYAETPRPRMSNSLRTSNDQLMLDYIAGDSSGDQLGLMPITTGRTLSKHNSGLSRDLSSPTVHLLSCCRYGPHRGLTNDSL